MAGTLQRESGQQIRRHCDAGSNSVTVMTVLRQARWRQDLAISVDRLVIGHRIAQICVYYCCTPASIVHVLYVCGCMAVEYIEQSGEKCT